jgi:hypothetical protein
MRKQYYIFDLVEKRYYASFPDHYSLDVLDAVAFDTEQEAINRIDEIITNGLCLIVIENYVRN